MSAARRAGGSVLALLAGVAVLPGVLYGLGLLAVNPWPEPASGSAAMEAGCAHPRPVRVERLDPWGVAWRRVARPDEGMPADTAESEATYVARRQLSRQPHGRSLHWQLTSAALTIWITRNWTVDQIVDTARDDGYCLPARPRP